MATAPPSPERLELGPGVFWLRSKSFSLRLPRARGDFTPARPGQARPGQAGPGQARSGGEARQRWRQRERGLRVQRREQRREERGEGRDRKSRGGQALGGGRAESQEHYIITGAESGREGYESVD